MKESDTWEMGNSEVSAMIDPMEDLNTVIHLNIGETLA